MVSDSPPAEEILPGVFILSIDGRERIATRSAIAISVYGERIIEGFRLWDPSRSKLASLILKARGPGLRSKLALDPPMKALYLGAATGTTVSHLSDILASGLIYAVEMSPRAMRDLIHLCAARENIIPILGDARQPLEYSRMVEQVDLIYQDVASRDQSEIASRNAERYLLPGGRLILMIKSRSVDATLDPRDVYRDQLERLRGLEVEGTIALSPYHKDHLAVMARKI
ncbi:MAG: fibrillarin-like rRNA/tRNA 2'-O-methyltransferase [Methanotrichaceae archaeon]|nr:fibrillarin-like rRNA/tRNA 2'-O-methyltransferase [Methanotrichaceae archaeon]